MALLRTSIAACLLLVLGLSGCASWKKPRLDREERAILNFNFSGIGIGSPVSELKRFAQIQKIPGPVEEEVIYQIYNPNPQISMAVVWFRAERVEKIELRYIDSSVVQTLTSSGGWQGILDYIVERYGPPSKFGPNVAVAATVDGLDPAKALFNGEWLFSRVYRQFNYIAVSNQQGSLAVVTLEALPLPEPEKKKKPKKGEFEQASPAAPNPGF